MVGITASFPHRLLSPKNPEIAKLNKERAQLKKNWNLIESKHDSLLAINTISIADYLKIKSENSAMRIKDFRGISKKRRELVNNFSFNGRSSLHFWLWVLGIFISLLICSFFLAIKDIRLKKAGLLKWYEPPASISFIAVSLFWLYHTIFQRTKDFELSIYTLYLVLVLIPLSYFIYHFLRRFSTIEEKLLENIRILVSHILKNTKEDKEKEKWNVLEKISENGR